MKHFKKSLFVVFLVFAGSFVFARTGILTGKKDLKVVKTTWFDFIYPESCSESAAVLANHGDSIYEELVKAYGWETPVYRLPVVLTDNVESFNAYFSSAYYNRIVLYITSTIPQLENQTDTLLATFKHELTHAFTMNMKDDLWQNLSKFFGDAASFGLITITPGTAEGATVTSESSYGYGRLNDEYFNQMIKQAKLEGKFPRFSDVQGVRDIYPAGSYYYFNGAFHQYLQKKYGMEKYAQWWYRAVNKNLLSFAFKKTYGISLSKAWKDFKLTYEVPEITANPVRAGISKDFYCSEKDDYSSKNKAGYLPDSLSISEKGLVYLESKEDAVYFVSASDFENSKIIPEKLFVRKGLSSAVQSADGRFIAITYLDEKAANIKSHVAVFDTETKKFFTCQGNGLKAGSIVKKNSDYYLVKTRFKGEKSEIVISKLALTKGSISEEENISLPLERNISAGNYIDLGQGNFAFRLVDNLNFRIRVMNVEGKILEDYSVPVQEMNFEKFYMRDLSYNSESNSLYFDYVSKGIMPRLGKLDLNTGKYSFGKEDISGGVYNPVLYKNQIIYKGEFYENNRLLKRNLSDFDFTNSSKISKNSVENFENSSVFDEKVVKTEDFLLKNSKNYKNSDYLKRGLFIPFSNIQSVSYDSYHSGCNNYLPFGLTFRTSDSWGGTIYELSAGYGFDTNSEGIELTVTSGTSTNLFRYSINGFAEFDTKGWKAAKSVCQVISTIPVGNHTDFVINPSNTIYAGRPNANREEQRQRNQDFFFGKKASYCDDIFLYEKAGALVYFDTRTAYSKLNKSGFVAGLGPYYTYCQNLTDKTSDMNYGDITVFAAAYLPRLLPLDCVNRHIYNLPSVISASVFSASTVGNNFITLQEYPDLAYVSGEIYLYSYEMQQSLGNVSIFFLNDMTLSVAGVVGYDYADDDFTKLGFLKADKYIKQISNGENQLRGNICIKFTTGGSITNFGQLANSQSKISSTVAGIAFYDQEGFYDYQFGWWFNLNF